MGIQIEYMPLAELKRRSQSWQDQVLGAVSFGNLTDQYIDGNIPVIHLNTPVLSGSDFACEGLLADKSRPPLSGKKDLIDYRINQDLLFGVINIDESSALVNKSPDLDTAHDISVLQQATETAYQQIFSLIEELGYPQVYRFWNYMADINGSESNGSLERYREFNVGRKNVFEKAGREHGQQLPAACALGLQAGPLSIAFLAGKTPATAIENPRQVKAYHYPQQYGPRTPSFSRATLAQIGQQFCLFISGTASIVGHETLHDQDIIGQTNETLINLEAVVSEANRVQGETMFSLSDACFRVYVRHAADLQRIRETLRDYFRHEVRAVFVQADICRQELLIEIEATLQSAIFQPDVQAMRTV